MPYVGEIRMFAGNFPPAGWMFCDGSILPISENETLFFLIGTTYGGDGQNTFALPDLRGRIPVHNSTNFALGQAGGVEEVTLNVNQIPSHTHLFLVSGGSESASPSTNFLGASSQVTMFFGDPPNQNMRAGAVSSTGGSQPHTNFQPYLCINFIISLYGIYPTQN